MKVSVNWLKDYIKPGISADQLAHKMTMAGLEVEAIHSIGNDRVFEIEVTPNRADCLSMVGMAREVSAICNRSKKDPKIARLRYPRSKGIVKIEDKKGCRRYIGTVIENLKAGKTPEWIKKRLASLGLRSINSVVDITNFCLMELGQPLHAFDFDKLEGGRIIVRRAKKGERIVAIDDQEYELDESILVIADERKAVAIAGIMGGKDTEVTSQTKNILLESAYFDPILIRRGSRKLGLASDSSYRFERGVDPKGVKLGSDRAASLILEIAKGRITKYSDIHIKSKAKPVKIKVKLDEVNDYLGADLTKSRAKTILKRLDFDVRSQAKDRLMIIPPSSRSDVTRQVDIVEELARIEGYDAMPSSFPTIKISDIVPDTKRELRKRLKDNLLAQGFFEAITYSMTNQESLDKAKQGHLYGTRILNPLSQDQEMLRPTLLPSLLSAISYNVNRDIKDIRLFETGKVYIKEEEREALGIALTGVVASDWRLNQSRQVDFFDAKGAVVQALRQIIGDRPISFMPIGDTVYEEGSSALIQLGAERLGTIGKLDEEVLTGFGIKDAPVWFVQIDLEKVYKKKRAQVRYEPVSAYPAVVRDISLTFDKSKTYGKLLNVIQNAGARKLVEINFKEDYTDIVKDKIDKGHRGILVSLTYQSDKRTLEEDEVNEDHQKILDALVDQLNVVIR